MCEKRFRFYNRRHHCRLCGRVGCAACVSVTELPSGAVKICLPCAKTAKEGRPEHEPVVREPEPKEEEDERKYKRKQESKKERKKEGKGDQNEEQEQRKKRKKKTKRRRIGQGKG